MASVSKTIQCSASPDAVWATVRDFGAIDQYVPPIVDAELSETGAGTERTLTLADGAQVVERLDSVDDDTRTLRYTIVESPLPIEDYKGSLSVTALDEGTCEVTWASSFAVREEAEEEMLTTFAELYTAGLNGLKEHLAQQ